MQAQAKPESQLLPKAPIQAKIVNDKPIGGNGNDTLIGDAGNNKLYGRDGDDYLLGGDGDDYLLGGYGNDCLYGDESEDTYGNDYLYGADGDDTYLISAGAGKTKITTAAEGADAGEDTVWFTELMLAETTLAHSANKYSLAA